MFEFILLNRIKPEMGHKKKTSSGLKVAEVFSISRLNIWIGRLCFLCMKQFGCPDPDNRLKNFVINLTIVNLFNKET